MNLLCRKLSKFDSTVEQLIRNELANVIRVASVPPHITPLNIQAQGAVWPAVQSIAASCVTIHVYDSRDGSG